MNAVAQFALCETGLVLLQSDDYIIQLGEVFNHRYRVEKVLGKGSFGQVWPIRRLR